MLKVGAQEEFQIPLCTHMVVEQGMTIQTACSSDHTVGDFTYRILGEQAQVEEVLQQVESVLVLARVGIGLR